MYIVRRSSHNPLIAPTGERGWEADSPAGAPVQDSAPWGGRLARRGSDRWPRGSPPRPPLPAPEEAAPTASWETRRLYLQKGISEQTLEDPQDRSCRLMVEHTVALIHIG